MANVLFIVTSLDSGGIENYLLRFLRYSQGRVCPVVLCKSGKFGDLYSEYMQIHGIELVSMKLGYFSPVGYFWLYKLIRRKKFDAVCDFTGNFSALPLVVARLSGVRRRVAAYRGATDHFPDTPFRSAYNKVLNLLVSGYATQVVSNSQAALDYFFGHRISVDSKFLVIRNGLYVKDFLRDAISLRETLGIPHDSFVVGHVGRVDPSKNHQTILDVAVSLCRMDRRVRFLLCGKGVDECFSERVTLEGLSDKIILLGFRRDVSSVLRTLDCFYFPSITEGQPNALLEAFFCGLPFVASDIAPIKEMVPTVLHSQLVSPSDVDGACQKILKIMQDARHARSLDLSGWAKDNFSANIQFEKFLSVFL